jgi:hypothetical protein
MTEVSLAGSRPILAPRARASDRPAICTAIACKAHMWGICVHTQFGHNVGPMAEQDCRRTVFRTV